MRRHSRACLSRYPEFADTATELGVAGLFTGRDGPDIDRTLPTGEQSGRPGCAGRVAWYAATADVAVVSEAIASRAKPFAFRSGPTRQGPRRLGADAEPAVYG